MVERDKTKGNMVERDETKGNMVERNETSAVSSNDATTM
jgi:hypothetical protein